jgi:ABC-2 type transport system permease protein
MRNTWTIAWRDFRAYFTTPIGYIVVAGFAGIMGWMFFFNLSHFNMQNLQYQQFHMGKGVSITDGILRPVYGNLMVIYLFVVPLMTMRLFAEERKLHTFEMLMTSPVKLGEIVLGKFLSALMLMVSSFVVTLTFPVILVLVGNPDPGAIATNIIGAILMSACCLSIGIFFSSLTENQIVAAALTFFSILFLWLLPWAQQAAGPVWSDILSYVSVISHFNNFGQGVLNSSDVLYYVSFVFIGLFMTHRVLDSYRWR